MRTLLVLGRRGQWLFHTTTYKALPKILKDGEIKPGTYDGFVSFSEYPITGGDISGNDVVLVLDKRRLAPLLDKVEYTEDWYDDHREQAAYIAGEGWREQYEPPDWLYEPPEDLDPEEADWWEPDPEDVEAEERVAELSSFLFKEGEREWVSKREGRSIKVGDGWLDRVLVRAVADVKRLTHALNKHGLTVDIQPLSQRGGFRR